MSTGRTDREDNGATDEAGLLAAFGQAHSAPEQAIVLHHIAALRGEHAVEGLLRSSELKRAQARAKAAEAELVEVEAALTGDGREHFDEDGARSQIELDLLGWEWEATVAEAALEAHPEWIEAMRAPATPALLTQLKEVDAALKRAIIKAGPLSGEVRRLRAEKVSLTESTVAAPDERALARLRKRLIGTERSRGGRRWYTGGNIDVTEALAERRAAVAVDVEMGLLERQSAARFNASGDARARLADARQRYREESQAWAVHQASLARARAKAERAAESVVTEEQNIGKPFEASLKARPRQLRAVFLRSTPFVDHALYAEWTGERFSVEATVGVETDESALVETLRARGATIVDHDIHTPSYRSWAKLTGGRRYEIALGKQTVYYVPHHDIAKSGTLKNADHPAPRSERGQLRMVGFTPWAAVDALVEWGIVDGLEPQVPYRLLYRGEHRYGRLTPWLEPFASGREEIAVPEGHMVLHGLTGVGGSKDAIDRLQTIVETGGLKSIAERRRLRLKIMTMSPVGDIASGIDMGVPAKIGKDTTYGGQIFFAMHPSILHRRDLWFSDRDFGGGHDRYPEYHKYAKKLGQPSIHRPCPVEGRRSHFGSGLGRTNEVYFLHEISWNDVDTLFVTHELVSAVCERIDGWKAQGLVPTSLRVESFDEPGTGDVAAGWHVDEASGEVAYLTGVHDERLSLSDKIQRRAREIQREWDGTELLNRTASDKPDEDEPSVGSARAR